MSMNTLKASNAAHVDKLTAVQSCGTHNNACIISYSYCARMVLCAQQLVGTVMQTMYTYLCVMPAYVCIWVRCYPVH